MVARIDLAARSVTCSVHDLLPEAVARSLGVPGEGLSRLSVGAELHRVVQGRAAVGAARVRARGVGRHHARDRRLDAARARARRRRRPRRRRAGDDRGDQDPPLPLRAARAARARAARALPLAGAHLRPLPLPGGKRRAHSSASSTSAARTSASRRCRGRRPRCAPTCAAGCTRWSPPSASARRCANAGAPPPRCSSSPSRSCGRCSGKRWRRSTTASPPAGTCCSPPRPGVGKTAAALFPAVRQALLGRTAASSSSPPRRCSSSSRSRRSRACSAASWRSIQIRAKAKMCANREVICHEEYCEYARDYGLKLGQRGVLPALLSFAPHLDPDRIYAVAHAAEVCPFEVSLELLRECSAVVCDYNYVFDPAIGLFGQVAGGEIEDTLLVIDEAHNLVDRARGYYSPRLSAADVRQARELLRGHHHKVCRDLDDRPRRARGADRRHRAARARRAARRPPDRPRARRPRRAAARPRRADRAVLHVQAQRRPVAGRGPGGRGAALARAPHRPRSRTAARSWWRWRSARRAPSAAEIVRIECLDAARFIRPLLASTAGCIAMSATLEPFEFYRDLLGFEHGAHRHAGAAVSVPAGEPRGGRGRRGRHHLSRARRRHYGRIAELVAELAPAGRNALALFPSYAFLREVANRISVPGHRVEIQRGDDSDRRAPRHPRPPARQPRADAAAGRAGRGVRRGRRLPRRDALRGDGGLPCPAAGRPRARAAQGVLRRIGTSAASSTPTSSPA